MDRSFHKSSGDAFLRGSADARLPMSSDENHRIETKPGEIAKIRLPKSKKAGAEAGVVVEVAGTLSHGFGVPSASGLSGLADVAAEVPIRHFAPLVDARIPSWMTFQLS